MQKIDQLNKSENRGKGRNSIEERKGRMDGLKGEKGGKQGRTGRKRTGWREGVDSKA